jgi:hypothetical protein
MTGSILYSTISTRPDIAYAVGIVSRYMRNPGEKHAEAAVRVLRYLNGSRQEGLEYDGGSDQHLSINAWCDASWADSEDDRKSTSGYIVKLNNCTVSWASKKQATVSLSTAEAEYMAISSAIQELQWIKH